MAHLFAEHGADLLAAGALQPAGIQVGRAGAGRIVAGGPGDGAGVQHLDGRPGIQLPAGLFIQQQGALGGLGQRSAQGPGLQLLLPGVELGAEAEAGLRHAAYAGIA